MTENILHIMEPFYSAGRKFGWEGRPIGLGIRKTLLEGDGILRLRVGDKPIIYQIDKKVARAFIKQYKSNFKARGTMLGVIAWHIFKREESESLETAIKLKGLFD